jgi:hypothetical protein
MTVTLPVYYVYVDWDCPDWSGPHDFSTPIDTITDDVKHLRISRGKDKDSNTYPAATLEMVLENASGKYYPTATAGDLVGKVRLWLPVKVVATHGGNTYNLFYGYINRITAYPIIDNKSIYFYATDGIDLLTKTIVVQDMDDKTVMSDGEATHRVLNAANWNQVRACTMQNAGDTVTDAGHGLANGDQVMFIGSSIPAAVDTETVYYVCNKADDTFQVEASVGDGFIPFAGDGTGFYVVILRRAIDLDGGDIAYFPDTFEFTKP